MPVTIRAIQPDDDFELARIIRAAFEEFDMPKEGTVYSDYYTDHLYTLFREIGSCYFVAEEDGLLLGGCGIYPTPGLPEGYAELVKLYLSPMARGKGVGKILIEKCIHEALELRYKHLYLESFPQLAKAVSIYDKVGFKTLDRALGNSGHFACTIWMVKEL